MKDLNNVEVFHIETTKEGMFAYISFQRELGDGEVDMNNGYDHIRVPINPREIQLSSRDNVLVDQSVKEYIDVAKEGSE